MSANPIIEGRAYLYNFDFLRFRGHAEETIRPVNLFQCQGVCWKAKFAGTIRLYVNGKEIFSGVMDCGADAHCFLTPFRINGDDEVCILVTDTEPRWFRWFRPNMAHVTLEGLECEP